MPDVLSITSKTAQEEGRVLQTVLRKGASVTILLRLLGILNITSGKCTGGRCWEWGLCNNFTNQDKEPLLTEKESFLKRFRRGERRRNLEAD